MRELHLRFQPKSLGHVYVRATTCCGVPLRAQGKEQETELMNACNAKLLQATAKTRRANCSIPANTYSTLHAHYLM